MLQKKEAVKTKKLRGRRVGVYPLFCVACGRRVGVVNVDEFERMVVEGDDYICRECLKQDAEDLENDVALRTGGQWFETVTRAEVAYTR